MFAQSECDFVAGLKQELIRVQVKSSYLMTRASGYSYEQATVRKGSGDNGYKDYTKDHCDVIFIVGLDDKGWIIPVEIVGRQKTIVVNRSQEIRRRDPRAFNPSPYEVTL